MAKEIRQKTVKIKLNDDEYSQLQAKKTSHYLAAWMREYCLSSKVQRFRKTADPILIRQLAGIGNNLNQIARKVNSEIVSINSIEILAYLKSIELNLKLIGDNYDKHF